MHHHRFELELRRSTLLRLCEAGTVARLMHHHRFELALSTVGDAGDSEARSASFFMILARVILQRSSRSSSSAVADGFIAVQRQISLRKPAKLRKDSVTICIRHHTQVTPCRARVVATSVSLEDARAMPPRVI